MSLVREPIDRARNSIIDISNKEAKSSVAGAGRIEFVEGIGKIASTFAKHGSGLSQLDSELTHPVF